MIKHTLKTLWCSHHNPYDSFKKKPCCWHVLQTSDRSYKIQFCFCRKKFVETKINMANQFFKVNKFWETSQTGKNRKRNLWKRFVRTITDKSTAISNINFSMEYFTADFLRFGSTAAKICLLVGWLSIFSLIASFSRISLEFLDCVRSEVLSHLTTREATCIFTFWW